MGIFRGSNGGIVLSSTGGLSTAASTYSVAPSVPGTVVTLTWAGAGDETRGNGGVQEGTAGDWNDGTTGYSNLMDVVDAQSGDVTIQLPSGDFQLSGGPTFDRGNVSNTGVLVTAIVGTVDGNGDPTTCLKGGASGSPVLTLDCTGDPRTMHIILKDLEIGEFQNIIDAWDGVTFGDIDGGGGRGVSLIRPAMLSLVNCRIRGLSQDGVGAGAGYEEYEYGGDQVGSRHTGFVAYYDTETYLCGDANRHGTYCHGNPIYGFRSHWHHIRTGHCLKLDSHYYFEDCKIWNAVGTTYSSVKNERPVNVDGFASGKFKNCDLRYTVHPTTTAGRSFWYKTGRLNAHWGYSDKVIPWWDQDTTGAGSYGVPTSRAIKWATGGYTAPSGTYSGNINSSYTSGSTSIVLSRWTVPGRESGNNSSYATNTGTDYYTIVATDGVTVERKTVTLPSAVTSATDAKTATLESGGFSFNLGTTDAFIMYETSAGPDTVVLNPEFWDPNNANYYWDKVQSGGSIIKTSDAIEKIIFEDCTITLTNNNASSGDQAFIHWIPTEPFFCSSALQTRVCLPLPPLNSPTTAYSDTAGNGEVNFDAGTDFLTGDDPTTSDFIWPELYAFGNCGIIYKGSQSFNKDGHVTNGSYSQDLYDPNVATVSGGTVTDVATVDGSGWLPTSNSTTLNGAASLGASSVTVTSATGFSAGKRILFINESAAIGESPVHATNVGSGYTTGTSIPIDDVLPWALADGSDVVVVADMGTKPSWWLEGNSWVVKA